MNGQAKGWQIAALVLAVLLGLTWFAIWIVFR